MATLSLLVLASASARTHAQAPQTPQPVQIQQAPQAPPSSDAPTFVTETKASVQLEVGETRLMQLPAPVIRVSIANPEVSDVQVVTPQQVLITAKSVGFTHLILWSNNEKPVVISVSCTRNLDQLREQFSKLFAGNDIRVSSVGELIVLSGTVSDVRVPARAAEVARLHSEKVANLIQVSGDQQVQLDIRFAEVSRSGLRRMGAGFLWQDNARGFVGGQTPPGAHPGAYLNTDEYWVPGTSAPAPPNAPFVPWPDKTGAFNYFFSTSMRGFPFSAIMSILAQHGLAKVLAEPTLVAFSGQDAKFHAGGEVPIVVTQALGSVSVRFKQFGVLLSFTPTVLGKRTLSLRMRVEVSEPDPTVGVNLGGYSIPGFRTRSSDTTIRLRDGQSFAIAGLLSDSTRHIAAKTPLLGDLPILGALFRSTSYQREETELLMVATAHLVKPVQPGDVPMLPGENEYNDPSDFELFVLGKMSGDEREAVRRRKRHGERSAEPAQAAGVETVNPHEGPIGPIGFIRE